MAPVAYNLGIMRRWLLAVFMLQLFLNVAGFALPGQGQGDMLANGPVLSAAVLLSDAQTPRPKGLADPTHGLVDELPDLPDTLLRPAAARANKGPAPAHAGWVHAGSPAPLPDTLLRPPQRA